MQGFHMQICSLIIPWQMKYVEVYSLHISVIFIPAFFFRKKGYINFVLKSVRRPSVPPCGCASVTFLVNVSPPKRLEVATSNIVAE